MNALTIAQLAQFSGIKAHTIRIWEQRYHALNPERTEGNTRVYSDLDLKRLLNIVSLMDSNKISELCKMSDEALSESIKELYDLDGEGGLNQFVPQLVSAGMEFNETAFRQILSHCFENFGAFQTYKEVVYPLLNRVGLMWSADMLPPAQEHFMCNLIRQKLLSAIDALPIPSEINQKWMLFLPEDEFHEIGLLFASYILKHKGYQVVYVGTSVPLSTLRSAIDGVKPDFLLLFFVHHDFPNNVLSYLSEIKKIYNSGLILVAGNRKSIPELKLDRRIQWLENVDDLEKLYCDFF